MHTHNLAPSILHENPGKDNQLEPVYDLTFLEDVKQEATILLQSFQPVPHKEILQKLLSQIERIDFREKAGFGRNWC